jgi:chemotaxis protein CheD
MINDSAVRRVHIIQGEYKVLSDPDAVLSTILGSCVAACLRDPIAGVGGMNHFLLPGNASSPSSGGDATRYGVHLMELLINGLLKQGARRDRLANSGMRCAECSMFWKVWWIALPVVESSEAT